MKELDIKKKESSAIVKPKGNLDLSNAKDFKSELSALYNEGYDKIIIDLAEVKMIQSSGVGALLSFNDDLIKNGGELKIINVNSDYIKKIFKMTKINKIIEVEGMD